MKQINNTYKYVHNSNKNILTENAAIVTAVLVIVLILYGALFVALSSGGAGAIFAGMLISLLLMAGVLMLIRIDKGNVKKVTAAEVVRINGELEEEKAGIGRLGASFTPKALIILKDKCVYRFKYNNIKFVSVKALAGDKFVVTFGLEDDIIREITYPADKIMKNDKWSPGAYLKENKEKNIFDKMYANLRKFNPEIKYNN
jgi:hypothetical protein